MPISEDPLNPLIWIESGSNPEGGADLDGDPLNPAHLWFSPVSKVHSIPLPHFPPAPPQNSTEIQKEGTGDQHGGAPGRLLKWALWISLPLCMLLGAGIVLLYRHFTRRAANLRLSRNPKPAAAHPPGKQCLDTVPRHPTADEYGRRALLTGGLTA